MSTRNFLIGLAVLVVLGIAAFANWDKIENWKNNLTATTDGVPTPPAEPAPVATPPVTVVTDTPYVHRPKLVSFYKDTTFVPDGPHTDSIQTGLSVTVNDTADVFTIEELPGSTTDSLVNITSCARTYCSDTAVSDKKLPHNRFTKALMTEAHASEIKLQRYSVSLKRDANYDREKAYKLVTGIMFASIRREANGKGHH